MKKNIRAGAYGWRHKHWLGNFYPDDLPTGGDEDWRLSYYSNEFSTVLVPFDYWQNQETSDCESWIDDVNDDFQFFVECHESMLVDTSLSELTDNLIKLQSQLSGLVFIQGTHALEEGRFQPLIDALAVDVFTSVPTLDSAAYTVWQQGNSQLLPLAVFEDDLSDLRAARMRIERWLAAFEDAERQLPEVDEMTVILQHPHLQVSDLSKFCTVLQIMGY